MKMDRPVVSEFVFGRCIVDCTLDNKLIYANQSFSDITGYTNDELVNSDINFMDLIPPQDLEIYAKELTVIATEKIVGMLEHRLLCKDGTILHVTCLGEYYHDENGHYCSKVTICDYTENITLREKYIESQMQLDALMTNVPGGVALYEIFNTTIKIVEANKEYYSMLGYSDRSMHPGTVGHMISEDQYKAVEKICFKCVENKGVFSEEVKLKKNGGEYTWLSINGKYFGLSEDENPLIYAVIIDISESKRAQREIFNQNERYKVIAENTDEIYFDYNVKDDVLYLQNCQNTAYETNQVVIKAFLGDLRAKKFIHSDDYNEYYNQITGISNTASKGSVEFRINAFDRTYKWYKMPYVSVANDIGDVTNVYGKLVDIEQVKNLKRTIDIDKAEIERLTATDAVTGLLNRKAFKKRVTEELQNNYDDNYCYGIVYSDINDFAYVNDNFGFIAGNKMLCDFANVISELDFNLYACRIYSDLFVGLYRHKSRDELINCIKERNDTFNRIQKEKYPASDIHVSCGLYVITDRNIDITVAIDNANLARRSVKGSKDIPCGIYTERMRRQRSHDQAIASELKSALNNGSIELFLQPKFSLITREIIGAEALSRWRNPDGTYKLPHEFISTLEKVGYIVDLDFYIYEQVLKVMSEWKRQGKRILPVSINFSRLHNNYDNFADRVIELANSYGIDKNLIEVEITESSFTHDIKSLFSNMKKLRNHGFKIDIDDFGMGYSSLSVLLHAPVDIVKVDKVFIDNIENSLIYRNYVNKICELISSTSKQILFEGVETEKQAEILSEKGHIMAQGWLFDKAMPVSEFNKKYQS